MSVPENEPVSVDVLIVGAGFAGMYMLLKCREIGVTARVVEAGGGVGGTWYWNRYPGARCDVPSLEYSYQFSEELEQEWDWSERYAPQPEILAYANHVADRFDLKRDITFSTRVTAAAYDADAARWRVETDIGAIFDAHWVVMATGCLSSTNKPAFEGLESYRGETYHTGEWSHDGVDFTGKRVAVIGTGSSAIQSIPIIAGQAADLTVFQRTANYSIPAHNAPMDPAFRDRFRAHYRDHREAAKQDLSCLLFHRDPRSALEVAEAERRSQYEQRWADGGLGFSRAFSDLLRDRQANDTAAEFVREKIRAVVEDPETAALLSPTSVLGCKRLCVDSGYYETFNLPHVHLVDVSKTPIERLSEAGVVVGACEYPADAIVFATGFDAMTGSLTRVDIRGRDGVALKDAWAEGPKTYLGLSTVGFPNLFMVSGPGSPSVLTNMLPSIEQHVEWIAACIRTMEERQARVFEPTAEAQDAWVDRVNRIADATLMPTCNSWYLGANVPGKPRVFMPYIGFPEYVEACEDVVADGYRGFRVA